jgi:DNA-binding transcriptional LysR family regulator
VEPQVVLQLGTTEAVKQAVMASTGVAVLSRWAVRGEIESGRLTTIGRESLSCHRKFSYVVRRSRQITDVQRAFLDLVQETDGVKIAS